MEKNVLSFYSTFLHFFSLTTVPLGWPWPPQRLQHRHVTAGPSGEARPQGHWPRVGKGQQSPCASLRVGVGDRVVPWFLLLTTSDIRLHLETPCPTPRPGGIAPEPPITRDVRSKELGCRNGETLGAWFHPRSISPSLSDSPPWSSGGFPCGKGARAPPHSSAFLNPKRSQQDYFSLRYRSSHTGPVLYLSRSLNHGAFY